MKLLQEQAWCGNTCTGRAWRHWLCVQPVCPLEDGVRRRLLIASQTLQQAGQREVPVSSPTRPQPRWLVRKPDRLTFDLKSRGVSWCHHRYPWGHEAFEKAKTEDKPIFLSGNKTLLNRIRHQNRNDFCFRVWTSGPTLISYHIKLLRTVWFGWSRTLQPLALNQPCWTVF